MTPNLGTKGNGEPVVQPAECKCVFEGCQGLRCVHNLKIQVVLPMMLLVLAACGQNPNPVSVVAQPQSLAYTGGRVNLSWENWNVAGARYYTLISDPALPGLPANITTTQTSILVGRNSEGTSKSYRLTLEAHDLSGSAALAQKTLEVRLESSPSCATLQSTQSQSLSLAAPQPGVGRFDVPHLAGRLMVYGQPGVSLQSSTAAQSLGASLVQNLGNGWSLYRTQPGQEARVAGSLYKQGVGQYVQPEYLYSADGLSTPPDNRDYAQAQSDLFKQMNLEQAWSQLQDGCNPPVVAVVDTGVYTNRADLAPNLTPKASWLDVVGNNLQTPKATQSQVDPGEGTGASHGTGVAGIIAASSNDGSALTGAAYNLVKVLPIKVFDRNRVTGTVQIAQALEYAAGSTTIAGQVFSNPSPARVVNLSLSLNAKDFSDPYLESVLQQLAARGMVVVASSGNTDAAVSYPASSPYVIAVGATNASGARAQWMKDFASNYGSDLEFVAPGTRVPVLSSSSKDAYGMAYGTSAAAPFISATVGLYIFQNQQSGQSFNPANFVAQVRQCLQNASQNGAAGWNPQTGYGLVDVAKVVNLNNPACYPKGNL